MEQYNRTELKVLWYIKRHGPITAGKGRASVLVDMANALDLGVSNLRQTCRVLEQRCLILRTYHGKKMEFGKGGSNQLIRIELVDPDMYLPPLIPIPLAVVVAHENEELYERTAHEPTADDILEALLHRITELQGQVDKLQDIVSAQADKIQQQAKEVKRKERDPHLTQRLQGALTPEQWEALTHKGK